MGDWYFARGGQQFGPLAESIVQQQLVTGELHPSDLVWTEGMPQWQPAGQVAALQPGGVIPPPLPTPGLQYANPVLKPAQDIGEDPGMRWLLPVGRSGWAIAAGYLGLFSVLLVPAPTALICALVAIGDIRKHPERHGMGRAVFGLIMGAIFSIGLLFMLIAAFSH